MSLTLSTHIPIPAHYKMRNGGVGMNLLHKLKNWHLDKHSIGSVSIGCSLDFHKWYAGHQITVLSICVFPSLIDLLKHFGSARKPHSNTRQTHTQWSHTQSYHNEIFLVRVHTFQCYMWGERACVWKYYVNRKLTFGQMLFWLQFSVLQIAPWIACHLALSPGLPCVQFLIT